MQFFHNFHNLFCVESVFVSFSLAFFLIYAAAFHSIYTNIIIIIMIKLTHPWTARTWKEVFVEVWSWWNIKSSLCGRCTQIVTNTTKMHESSANPNKLPLLSFSLSLAKENEKRERQCAEGRWNVFQPHKSVAEREKSIRLDIFPISAFPFARCFFFIFPSPSSSHYQLVVFLRVFVKPPYNLYFSFAATVFVFNSGSKTEVFALLFIGQWVAQKWGKTCTFGERTKEKAKKRRKYKKENFLLW